MEVFNYIRRIIMDNYRQGQQKPNQQPGQGQGGRGQGQAGQNPGHGHQQPGRKDERGL